MIELAVIARILLHLATVAAILCYVSHQRTNLGSTAVAVLIAGSSFAGAVQAIQRFEYLTQRADLWLLAFVAAVALMVISNGGNVARVLRRHDGR